MKTQTIEDFKDYKKYLKLTKKRSPLTVEFMSDDFPDEWLVTVVRYKSKTGIVVDNYMIIRKDFDRHLELFKADGYCLT